MFNGQLSLVKKLNIYTYVSVYTIVRHRYGESYMLCFLGLLVAMSLDRYINIHLYKVREHLDLGAV